MPNKNSEQNTRQHRNIAMIAANFRWMGPILWRIGKRRLALQILGMAVTSVMPAVGLAITKRLVDSLSAAFTSGFHLGPLVGLLGLQLAADALGTGLRRLQDLVSTDFNTDVVFELQCQVANRAAATPQENYMRPEFHDKLMQARSGLSFRGTQWLEQLGSIIQQVVTSCSVVVVTASVHWGIPLILVVIIIPTLVTQYYFGGQRFFQMRYQSPATRAMNYFYDLLVGAPSAAELRIFDSTRYFREKWEQHYWKNNRQLLALKRRSALFSMIFDAFALLAGAGAVLLLVTQGTGAAQTVGGYVVVLQAIQMARSQGQGLAYSIGQVLESMLFISDLRLFLEHTLVAPRTLPELQFPQPLSRGIDVEHLHFQYPSSSREVLSDISFHATPGERLAIVGENGSGKSTLVKCLLGLYTPTSGAILVDGVDHQNISRASYWKNVSAVFQDFVSYQLTIRENIAASDLSAIDDHQRLHEAIRKSGVSEIIDEQPDGMDTQLGLQFSGVELSKGQWQRLAMARAYFRDSQIIAMDEPTAALDPIMEARVFEQFADLSRGKIALLVSHRLGMCLHADRILVLKQGQLVEQGTHHELMSMNGEYARMYTLQTSQYLTAPSLAKELQFDTRSTA